MSSIVREVYTIMISNYTFNITSRVRSLNIPIIYVYRSLPLNYYIFIPTVNIILIILSYRDLVKCICKSECPTKKKCVYLMQFKMSRVSCSMLHCCSICVIHEFKINIFPIKFAILNFILYLTWRLHSIEKS